MIVQRLALLSLVILGCAGCAYRATSPVDLDHPVAVIIEANHGRLVRGQVPLQSSVASELREIMGWATSPHGPAQLAIILDSEPINVSSSGNLGIPQRWDFQLRGGWTLTAPGREPLTGRFSGTGNVSSRAEETDSLARAADNAARDLVANLKAVATPAWAGETE